MKNTLLDSLIGWTGATFAYLCNQLIGILVGVVTLVYMVMKIHYFLKDRKKKRSL